MTSFRHQPHPLSLGLPTTGPEIEHRSFEIVEQCIAGLNFEAMDARIVKRIVHATADVSIAETIRIHPEAMNRGMKAIRKGRPVFADVRMLQVGITRLAGSVHCAISEEAVVRAAREWQTTRAAAAIEWYGRKLHGAIVAVGNAPTAIWQLLSLHANCGITPSLVVGLPVGFVGAAEAKKALWESGLVCVTNVGPRGGSSLAAATLNAIAIAAREERIQ